MKQIPAGGLIFGGNCGVSWLIHYNPHQAHYPLTGLPPIRLF
jgi:hypothetical protein